MNWTERVRLAWRALRGGAPESLVRDRPRGWTRPPETLTGWDALMSDAAILHHQLRRSARRHEDAEEEIDRVIDELERRAEELAHEARVLESKHNESRDVDLDADVAVVKGAARTLEQWAESLRYQRDLRRGSA